jgi:enoyl-[acyl-carrier protein] reductase II
MVWVSSGKLAAAVSNAGGLGLIGAGSMTPELLDTHIKKAKSITSNPIGINLPILYSKVEEQIEIGLKNNIKIFFTSAGSPSKYTEFLKSKGCIVTHVTSSPELALKCQNAGVDAVVVEGFEAGGHNGKDELTSFALIPQARKKITIPLLAAGGISSGKSMLAAMILGADGVQLGTRFLLSKESSAHENFKKYILDQKNSNATKLLMKKTVPVRLLNNKFSLEIESIENQFTGEELKIKLIEKLSKGRAKIGMLDGNLDDGELELGQIYANIESIKSCKEIIDEIISEYKYSVCDLSINPKMNSFY